MQIKRQQVFMIDQFSGTSAMPNTLDAASRTVDCVWYGGQTVPRRDPEIAADPEYRQVCLDSRAS
jgi:hypothetical protein